MPRVKTIGSIQNKKHHLLNFKIDNINFMQLNLIKLLFHNGSAGDCGP